MAIAVNPELSYSIVEHASTGKLIVATDLIETLAVCSKNSQPLYCRFLRFLFSKVCMSHAFSVLFCF
jgi:isoleucyl-tRNA synthetase